jgi:hypothetical protein
MMDRVQNVLNENDALERAAREAENTPHSRWFRIAPHIRALKVVTPANSTRERITTKVVTSST